MWKRRVCTMAAFVLLLAALSANALAADNGMDTTISYTGVVVYGHNVVVDNFNGVYAYYDQDRDRCWDTWSCDEYPTRYYQQLYGVDLTEFFSWPYDGYENEQVSITVTYDPQPGDIALVYPTQRTGTSYYHAAIIKSVEEDTLTLVEQNYGYWQHGMAVAYTNRVIPWASSPDGVYGAYYDTYYVFRVTIKEPYTYFEDVPDTHWAAAQINALYEAGILSGRSSNAFCPDDTVTRAEFATLVYTLCARQGMLLQLMQAEEPPVFLDVTQEDWFFTAVQWAAQSGLVSGDNTGAFRPNDTISRQDMAVILDRLLQRLLPEQTASSGNLEGYADWEAISDYARQSVAHLTQLGILTDAYGKFYPNFCPSRAETAVLLYRAWQML